MLNQDNFIKSLLYRSNHRGCKETDILLGLFAQKRLYNFNQQELLNYQSFIFEDDAVIYDWILQKASAPIQYSVLVQDIRNFHRL